MSVVFYFNGDGVGVFEQVATPLSEGVYEYMPFRGIGHYEMGQQMSKKGEAVCSYKLDEQVIYFTVFKEPGYGRLRLTHFTAEKMINK